NRWNLLHAPAVGLVWVLFVARGGPDYGVALVSSGTGYQIVDVPLSEPVRGGMQEVPTVHLHEVDANNVVLRLEVDVFEGEEPPATVKIDNSTGETVWTGQIAKSEAETGTVLLLVDKSTFPPGRYTLEIFDRFGASLGQADLQR
ncbi:MAG: hypothetical protein P8181_13755, partial [bacterium]